MPTNTIKDNHLVPGRSFWPRGEGGGAHCQKYIRTKNNNSITDYLFIADKKS